jgi:hypothetical protein
MHISMDPLSQIPKAKIMQVTDNIIWVKQALGIVTLFTTFWAALTSESVTK